jgi:hypothetical protein
MVENAHGGPPLMGPDPDEFQPDGMATGQPRPPDLDTPVGPHGEPMGPDGDQFGSDGQAVDWNAPRPDAPETPPPAQPPQQ